MPGRRRRLPAGPARRHVDALHVRRRTARPPKARQYYACSAPAACGRTAGRRSPSTARRRASATSTRTSGSSTTSTQDRAEARDLAAEQPEQRRGARRPLVRGGREVRRAPARRPPPGRDPHGAAAAGRAAARARYVYYPDTAEVPESAAVNIRGRSYRMLAEVELTSPDAEGVIFAHGSRFGGHACSCTSRSCTTSTTSSASRPSRPSCPSSSSPARHVLGMEFTRESAGERGESHGTTRLYVNDEVVAEGPMRAQPGEVHAVRRRPLRRPRLERRGERAVPRAGVVQGRHDLQVEVNVGADQYLDLEKEAMAALARE